MSVTFVINYVQSNQPAAAALRGKLTSLYPASTNILMIEDNPRIKVVGHGGEWTQRWLTQALATDGDPIIKIDPDILVPRAVTSFPTADVFGHILIYADGSTHCCGGTFGISRACAQKIVDSKLLLDEKYLAPFYTYVWNGETVAFQDRIFADVCKRLGIKMTRCSEMWMEFFQSPRDPKQHAFIHPRVS